MNPEPYLPTLRAIAHQIADNYDIADDLLGEMVIKVLELPNDASPQLIMTSARNVALNAVQSRKYQYSYNNRFKRTVTRESLMCTSGYTNIDDLVTISSIMQQARLSSTQAACLSLFRAGYSHKEIANEMNIGISGIYSLMHNSIKRMREVVTKTSGLC